MGSLPPTRAATVLGPLWPELVEHLKATVTKTLNNNAQCELVIEDNASMTCRLDVAPNLRHPMGAPEVQAQIVVSTGQVIRVAVISKIIAERFDKHGPAKESIVISDPHYFDDLPDNYRMALRNRRPPPGMAPAFNDVDDAEHLWNWAALQLGSRPTGTVASYYKPICLYALSFLVAHEAAHLLRISERRRDVCGECWHTQDHLNTLAYSSD
jgi:hypothetical protein